MCRLPVSAAAESRTDAPTDSDGKQNLEGGGGGANKSSAAASALRPFRLIFRRRLTFWKLKLIVQQVEFKDGSDGAWCAQG